MNWQELLTEARQTHHIGEPGKWSASQAPWLQYCGKRATYEAYTTNDAAERGSAIHLAVEKGIVPTDAPLDVIGAMEHINEAENWLMSKGFKLVEREKYYSTEIYTGTVDSIWAGGHGEFLLAEIKTGKVRVENETPQLQVYADAVWRELPMAAVFSVVIQPGWSHRIHQQNRGTCIETVWRCNSNWKDKIICPKYEACNYCHGKLECPATLNILETFTAEVTK